MELPRSSAAREARQRLAVDEARADPRQLAFGDLREAPVQDRRDGAIQYGVADELEALVMIGAEAAVRERLQEQLRTAEVVAEPAAERDGRHSPSRSLSRRRQRVALASNSR